MRQFTPKTNKAKFNRTRKSSIMAKVNRLLPNGTKDQIEKEYNIQVRLNKISRQGTYYAGFKSSIPKSRTALRSMEQ
tara:strand:- start:21164 stop:21394 length:231 start_codon:yes stop_codon:yes gene_type:complete